MGESESSVFIGGGFSASQLLWVLPVVDGFCRQKNISKMVLERGLSRKLISLPHVQKVLERYEVVSLRSTSDGVGRIQRMVQAAGASVRPIRLLALVFGVSREILLQQTDRHRSQIRHAVWDSACLRMGEGSIAPSFFEKLLAGVGVLVAEKQAHHAVRKHGVSTAFLGHTVYHSRATLATFHSLGVQVFAHAAGVMYECPIEEDASWGSPSPPIWPKIVSLFSDAEVESYWQGRTIGKSSYADSEAAARGIKVVEKSTPKNLVLLHVFRDSPFNQIDESRIFSDYIDWVTNSLLTIAMSEETWLIKTHPSAKRWGENQETWLSEICKFVFGSPNLPPNVLMSEGEYSNMELFAHVNRVVTFGGTGHLEAAGWGIKPITVMDVGLARLDPSAVLVPRNKNQYRSLLLLPSESADFTLSEAQIALARSLLYARENVLTLGPSVGHLAVYKGDPANIRDADFENVLRTVSRRTDKLTILGNQLARGVPHSVCLDYLDQWSDVYGRDTNEGRKKGAPRSK